MKPQEMLDILAQASKLKSVTRHCVTSGSRKESVADHSWRLALMAMLISYEPEFKDTDMNKVIRMCLIHDLGESFTGDVPVFEKERADRDAEDREFLNWVDSFPKPQRDEWSALLCEMADLETKEARTYKALDKLEAVISHNESDIASWLPLEYDLQLTHGKEYFEFSDYLRSLSQKVDEWTNEKINIESSNAAAKKELRKMLKKQSEELDDDYVREASKMIMSAVLSSEMYRSAESVFMYVSMWNEPRTRKLLGVALRDGKKVYVPKCYPDHVMKAVRIRSGYDLSPGAMNIPEPIDCTVTADPDKLDLIIVPCVAASLSGKRIGHGAGYYDLFLSNTKAVKLCLCLNQMITEGIPMSQYDVYMDYVATEYGIQKCR